MLVMHWAGTSCAGSQELSISWISCPPGPRNLSIHPTDRERGCGFTEMNTTSLGQSEHTYLTIHPEGTNIPPHTSHQQELAGAGEGIIILGWASLSSNNPVL